MGNKCKICGYRFKSRDEEICPECFTAREDDITCARYSGSEHSHLSSYSSGLRDNSESFVQKELRLERNNQFARENFGDRARAGLDLSASSRFDSSRYTRNDYDYEADARRVDALYQQSQQPQPQQTAYQRFTEQQQRKASGSTTGFTPAGQVFAQRSTTPLQQAVYQRYTAQNKGAPKKKNTAAGTVFLVFFIMMFIAAIVISRINEEQEKNRSNYTTYYTTTQRTSRTTTATKQTTEKTTTTDKRESDSTSGHYSAQLLSVVLKDKKNSELNSELLNYATDFTKENDPWKEVTVKIKVKPGSDFADLYKEPTLTMATMQGLESRNVTTSLSFSSVHPKKKIEVKSDGTDITLKMLVNKNAKLIYVTVYFQSVANAAKESVRFNITVNQ